MRIHLRSSKTRLLDLHRGEIFISLARATIHIMFLPISSSPENKQWRWAMCCGDSERVNIFSAAMSSHPQFSLEDPCHRHFFCLFFCFVVGGNYFVKQKLWSASAIASYGRKAPCHMSLYSMRSLQLLCSAWKISGSFFFFLLSSLISLALNSSWFLGNSIHRICQKQRLIHSTHCSLNLCFLLLSRTPCHIYPSHYGHGSDQSPSQINPVPIRTL